MKTLLKTFLVLIGIFIIYFMIGVFTPKKYFLEASETYEHSIIDCWDVVTNIDSYPNWRNDVLKMIRIDSGDGTTWNTYTDIGGYISFRELKKIPYEKFEVEMLSSPFGMTGTWTYTFEGDDRKCHLTIIEHSVTDKILTRSLMTLLGRNTNVKRDFMMIRGVLDAGKSTI